MKRRQLFKLIGAGLAAAWLKVPTARADGAKTAAEVEAMRSHWQELRTPGAAVVEPQPALAQSKEQWRGQLPADAYGVLFEEDTERPLSSPLNEEHRAGLFACRACGLPLFTSAMKFDSGTGWPSFITSVPGHLATKSDFKLVWPRTEYHCVKCGGHQGHMFDDGPAPTGQRWCNNGVALNFIPLAA